MAVFVSGFDFETSENDIAQHFEGIGNIAEVRMMGRGAAVVHFDDPALAKQAVDELNETTISGNRRYINVRLDGEKGSKGGGGKGKKGGKSEDRSKGGKVYSRNTYDGEFQTGTVAKFISDRGFGYITPDRGDGGDVFVHFSAILGSDGFKELREGDRVEFGVEPDPKGKGKGSVRAVAVSII